jgi:hypothetical protein
VSVLKCHLPSPDDAATPNHLSIIYFSGWV